MSRINEILSLVNENIQVNESDTPYRQAYESGVRFKESKGKEILLKFVKLITMNMSKFRKTQDPKDLMVGFDAISFMVSGFSNFTKTLSYKDLSYFSSLSPKILLGYYDALELMVECYLLSGGDPKYLDKINVSDYFDTDILPDSSLVNDKLDELNYVIIDLTMFGNRI